MAKTSTAWHAVVLGVHLGAAYLELEGDAMEVVWGLNQADNCWGREGPVLNDIKMLLQNFNAWKVSHVHPGGGGGCS
jgi:hypothetical protein